MPPKSRFGLMALALVISFAGCSDLGTESFDPMGTSQKALQAFGSMSGNPAVQNFEALSGAFTWTGAPPVLEPGVAASPSSPTDILPPSAQLGKTFVYSQQTGKYTASDTPGAPSNGVRFLVYQVDTATRAIIIPPVSIGYLDLTNESSPAPNSLGVRAVVGGATVLDYKGGGSYVGGNFSLTAKGNVTGGTGQLEFDLSQSFSLSTGFKSNYKVTSPTPAISIETELSAPSPTMTIATLTVTEGRNKLVLNATGNEAAVTGTVKYNGSTLAKISGTGNDPVFTGQGGRVLSAQDLEGLTKLFDFFDQLLNGVDDLLAPTYFVLGFHP